MKYSHIIASDMIMLYEMSDNEKRTNLFDILLKILKRHKIGLSLIIIYDTTEKMTNQNKR